MKSTTVKAIADYLGQFDDDDEISIEDIETYFHMLEDGEDDIT